MNSAITSKRMSVEKANILSEIVDRLVEEREIREGPALYRAILDVIRPASHPLHDIVTWNQREAAELCRIEEIRYHLCSLKLTVTTRFGAGESVKLRYVNSIFTENGGGSREFYTVDEMNQRRMVVDEVKRQIVSDAMAFVKKYDRYIKVFGGALADIINAINRFINNSQTSGSTSVTVGGLRNGRRRESCKKKSRKHRRRKS